MRYLSGAETAKLVRQALKEAFPGVKFSVRSDHNSVNVRWTDGPSSALVDAIAQTFNGGYFDGMTDCPRSYYHKLDGESVHFARYIFTTRKHSDALIEKAIGYIARKFGVSPLSVADYHAGRALFWRGDFAFDLGRELNEAISRRSDRLAASPSKTVERVQLDGDDDYGAGTVGRNGSGSGNGCPRVERQQNAPSSETVQ